MESENELTNVSVVLHDLNRMSINTFLKASGYEIKGMDWGKKIKCVLLVIDTMQMRQKNKGANNMGKIKQAYLQEIGSVDAVIESLNNALQGEGKKYQITTNAGQSDERTEWINREKFLEFMIENAINVLSGNVGYLFQDDEKEQKKDLIARVGRSWML
ncbi:hypothetical protein [Trichococcus sp.]|uniref:hypothetical protein n=1 Tax=Trichococcus sp. TaxID=1985464 RepID=UPI003C7CE71B